MFLLWFILIVIVRPLPVSLWLSVDFVWDSLVNICWERADLLAFHFAVLFYAVLCSFSVWCLGKGVQFDCIGSWPLPFHLLTLILSLYTCMICVVTAEPVNSSALLKVKVKFCLNSVVTKFDFEQVLSNDEKRFCLLLYEDFNPIH